MHAPLRAPQALACWLWLSHRLPGELFPGRSGAAAHMASLVRAINATVESSVLSAVRGGDAYFVGSHLSVRFPSGTYYSDRGSHACAPPLLQSRVGRTGRVRWGTRAE
jgi:hypothetical protein